MNSNGELDYSKGWTKSSLPDFCDLIMGQSPPSSTYNLGKIGVPFYQGKSEFGDIYPKPHKYCSEPKKIACAGDILISVRAPVGPTNISPHKACIGRGLAALRPLDEIQSKFVLYLFRNIEPIISSQGTGSIFKAISKDFIEHLEFLLPPLPEQHQIVAKIEELFSELDNGIENLKRAREQLKTYRHAVLKYAFEGKLTEQWRTRQREAGNPPEPAEKLLARITAEREKHYEKQLKDWKKVCEHTKDDGKKKPTKPKKPKELPPLPEKELEELPALPEGWHFIKVSDITLGVEYGTSAKSMKEGKIPVLRMGNIQNFCLDWEKLVYSNDDEEIDKYLLRENDVLFNRTNSPELVGKCAIYKEKRPAIFAGYLIRINQIRGLVDAKYINYFLNSCIAKKHGNRVKTDGVNQSNINGEKLINYPMPYTSIEEQNVIVQEIESRLSVCDQLEETIEDCLKKSHALRQSVLKKAFSGELTKDWREKHPELVTGENSAEELLERIKAEKALIAGRKKSRSNKTTKMRKK